MKKIIFLLTLMLASCSPDSGRLVSGPPASAFQTINVYWNNVWNEHLNECVNLIAVERTIPKIKEIETVALKELFKGPSDEERKAGYGSTL